jgi:acetyl/propionyl-CoA carboxylase alpha subunit
MLIIKVNNTWSYRVENNNTQTLVNDAIEDFDLQMTGDRRMHLIRNNMSYQAEILSFDPKGKFGILKINTNTYHFSIEDQYDELLHKMGIDMLHAGTVSELKAPMPGLVLKILVEEGQEVKKGDNLLILEAMKMENIIKSPADVTIGSLKVKPGSKVEKNQVIIGFR